MTSAMLASTCLTCPAFASEAETEYDGSTVVLQSPSVEVDMSVLQDDDDNYSSPSSEQESLKFKNVSKDDNYSNEYYGTTSSDEDRYSKNSNEELEKIEREINRLESETSSYGKDKREDAIVLKPQAPKMDFTQQRSQYFSKVYTPYSNSYSKSPSSYGSRNYSSSYSSSGSVYSPRYTSPYSSAYGSSTGSYSPYLSSSSYYRPKSNMYSNGNDGPAVKAHAVEKVEKETIGGEAKIILTPPTETTSVIKTESTPVADTTVSNLEATEKKLKALQEEIEKEINRQKELTKALSEKTKEITKKEVKKPSEKTSPAKTLETKKTKPIANETKKITEKNLEYSESAAAAEAEDEAALRAKIEADIKAQAAAEAEARALAKKEAEDKKKNPEGTSTPQKENMKAIVADITKNVPANEEAKEVKTITKPLVAKNSNDNKLKEEIEQNFREISASEKQAVNNVYAQNAIESSGEKKKPLIAIQEDGATKIQEISDTVEEPSSSELMEVTEKVTTVADAGSIATDISKPISPASEETPKINPKETLLTIIFPQDSGELSDKAKEELFGVVDFLKQSPDIRVQIQAFSYAKNKSKSDARRMSLSRGLTVRSYLTDKGIKPVRLDIRALGDSTDKTPVDRVDIVLLD